MEKILSIQSRWKIDLWRLVPGHRRISIITFIDVRFDVLLAGIQCRILQHFLYLVRDRMLLMERGVHLTRFLFTIASFFFRSRDVTRLMRHTGDLPFIFHGRISRVRCPLGQVRLRISLSIRMCFVGIYFLYYSPVKCGIAAHYSFPFRSLFDQPCLLVLYPFYALCLSFLVIFYHSKLYFLIPLFLLLAH